MQPLDTVGTSTNPFTLRCSVRVSPEEVLEKGDVALGVGFGFARSAGAAPQVNGIFILCIVRRTAEQKACSSLNTH